MAAPSYATFAGQALSAHPVSGLERRAAGRNSPSLLTCCCVGGVAADPVGVAVAGTVWACGDGDHWSRDNCADDCL